MLYYSFDFCWTRARILHDDDGTITTRRLDIHTCTYVCQYATSILMTGFTTMCGVAAALHIMYISITARAQTRLWRRTDQIEALSLALREFCSCDMIPHSLSPMDEDA